MELNKKSPPAYSDQELEDLYRIGTLRYEHKKPPGFSDIRKKDNSERFGDFILWQEIINHAKNLNSDVIFVTNEKKVDWWEKRDGLKAPRSELIREFREVTGHNFLMYGLDMFLAEANKNFAESLITKAKEERERILKIFYDDSNKLNLPIQNLFEEFENLFEKLGDRTSDDFTEQPEKIRNLLLHKYKEGIQNVNKLEDSPEKEMTLRWLEKLKEFI